MPNPARLSTSIFTALALHAGALAVGATLAATPGPLAAQGVGSSRWNDPRVLDLVDRARSLRHSTGIDPDFRSYHAEARGYVYFYVDRADSAQQVLVKADQVALDLYWRAPDIARQHIVGLRDEKVLPTNIRYHLDHLTVVQDDFGDYIRLGDGDEVEEVLHPVGPGAESAYDFRLSDSLSISYAAGQEEVRVYEVAVRPKRMDRPGFVGTIFLDRDRAAIVRMNFSFTPVSYVDPYLDDIRIALDNSLWMGRWWLPYRQEVEIRREMPYFDFMAGSIIRSRFDIRGYDFNAEMPEALVSAPAVSTESPSRRRSFAFERGLFDDLEESGGLVRSPSIEAVEEEVREVVEDQVMSGLSTVRFHVAQLSDFARYDRAEGIFLGGGATVRPRGDWLVRGTGGYAIGRRRPSAGIRVGPDRTGVVPTLEGYWDRLVDIGGHPGATPLENTISAASGSDDFLDPYFARGATLTIAGRPARAFSLALRWEEHVGARDVVSDGPDTEFRPVRSIEEGSMVGASATLRLALPGGGTGALTPSGGLFGGRGFAKILGQASWIVAPLGESWSAEVGLSGGIVNPGAPAQTMFLLGGRHTLPGHPYRLFAGNAYWLARAETTLPVHPPWVGVRMIGGVGSTYLTSSASLPGDWAARGSQGLRGYVGLGLSIGYDSMRFDVARAVGGTGWEAVFSVAPRFRSWL